MQVPTRLSFFARQAGVSKPLLLTVAALAAVVGWRLVGRVQAQSSLREQTEQLAQPTVSFVQPRAGGTEGMAEGHGPAENVDGLGRELLDLVRARGGRQVEHRHGAALARPGPVGVQHLLLPVQSLHRQLHHVRMTQ